jgi:hypothetical protein
MIIVINCRYRRNVLTPHSSRPVKLSPEAEGVMDAGFPGLRGRGSTVETRRSARNSDRVRFEYSEWEDRLLTPQP